jgi:hypothetical protein
MLRTNFKNSVIHSFYDKFSDFSDTKNYLFIGKVTEWENDNTPPTTLDSLKEELDAWKNMLVCKRISLNDIVFVIRRIDWTYNTKYTQYDDSSDLYSETTPVNFYVLTSDNNVYKCISNNNGGASQYSPIGTSTEEIITQDGYIWKYLYSIRPELQDFITEEYIPVEYLDELSYTDQRSLQLDVEQDAKANKNGSISNIKVTQIGSSYPFAVDYILGDNPETVDHLVQMNIPVGGTTIKFNTNSNISRIDNIYNDNYVVYIYSGTGSGQVRTITDYDGSTGIATVDEGFTDAVTTSSYYKILPKIQITGNGTGAIAIPVVNPTTKLINLISVIDGGQNYKDVTVEIKTSKTTESEKTKARAIISPFNGHGSSALIELGCKDVMILTKFDKEQIQNLKFYNDYRQVGIIQDISVTGESQSSQTYTFDIENINSTTSMILSGDYSSFLSIIQANPTLIVKQGSDDNLGQAQGTYSSFDITTNTLILKTVNGKFMSYPSSTVYSLVIEDYPTVGTDTVFANIDITKTSPLNYYSDTTFLQDQIILGQDSKATAKVLSWKPTFFGTDGELVVKDLRGAFIESYYNDSGTLVNGERIIGFNTVDTTTGIVGFSEDKVGIIKNTVKTQVSEGTNIFRATTVLTIVRPSGTTPFTDIDFLEDDSINQLITGAKGTVVGWSVSSDGLTGTLILSGTTGTFSNSINSTYSLQKLVNGFYVTQDAVISIISLPEVDRYSGKIIYIENIRPVVRGDDQTEEIKIIIGL